jgi:hypothetical protein
VEVGDLPIGEVGQPHEKENRNLTLATSTRDGGSWSIKEGGEGERKGEIGRGSE